MKVKTNGRNMNIFACIGSAGVGFSFCCRNIEAPMITGHTPTMRNSGGPHGIRPNRLNSDVGSGADRS